MIENSKHLIYLLVSAALLVGLGGCSTLDKFGMGKGAPDRARSGSVTAEGVYYAASADLPLYQSPGGAIITRLPQYAKLHRDRLQKGYAQVRVDSTGETGWVENARLIWRLPEHASPSPAAESESESTAMTPSPQPVEPPAPPAPPAPQAAQTSESPLPQAVEVPRSPAPAGSTVAPSIFNPY